MALIINTKIKLLKEMYETMNDEKQTLLNEIGQYSTEDIKLLIREKQRIDKMRRGEIAIGRKSVITGDIAKKVLTDYQSGKSAYRIALDIGVSHKNVINFLKRSNVYRSRKDGGGNE